MDKDIPEIMTMYRPTFAEFSFTILNIEYTRILLILLLFSNGTPLTWAEEPDREWPYLHQNPNCYREGLPISIPNGCKRVRNLSLRGCLISELPPATFVGCKSLTKLDLSHNQISKIEANTFIGAPQLKSIKLLYNNLQVFDRYALNGTENRLRNIYLSRNSLRVIENGTFQLVPKLEVIDLYQNSLSQLTSGVFQHLKNLERLFLGMNKLVNLPEDIFKDLSSLVYLDLSNNSLTTLSIDLFAHMDYLMTIDLSGNRLISIGNVLHLPNIRLDLRWNKLHQLDNLTLEILTSNAEILFLKGNPWYCDCSMEPLRQWYQQLSISNVKYVKIDNPVCSYPSELANHTINNLSVSLCMEIPASSEETSTAASRPFPSNNEFHNDDNVGIDKNVPMYQYSVTERAESGKTDDKLLILIVGIAVAFTILIALVIVMIIIVIKFRKRHSDEKGSDAESNENTPLKFREQFDNKSHGGRVLTPEKEILNKERNVERCSKKLDFKPSESTC